MNKKKIIIIVFTLIVLLILIVILSKAFYKDKIKYDEYTKYETTITIDYQKGDELSSTIIKVLDDGSAASLTSTLVGKESYIVGDDLYYIDGTTIYDYKTLKSYRNLYSLFTKIKRLNKDKIYGEYTYYTASVESKNLNEILNCLYFGKSTNENSLLQIVLKSSRIDEVHIPLNIDGYTSVTVNIKFKELSSSFKVDTQKLYGSSSLGSTTRYKIVTTKENPYEVIE